MKSEDAITQCANCDRPLESTDAYCRACGQQIISPESRTFAHLVKVSAEEATSLDGRALRSFALLLSRPGYLSRQFRLGRRQRYITPIGLFLMANLVFFLLPGLTDFSLNLSNQLSSQFYSGWVRTWIESAAARTDGGFDALALAYQMRSDEIAKVLVIFHVPFLALVSLLLSFSRRHFFADHVVAALHLFAFLMLYYALMPFTIEPLLKLINAVVPFEIPVWSLAVSLQFLYVPLMLRGAFGYAWLRVLPTALAYLFGLLWVHFLYRFALFLLAFGSLSIQ